MSNKTITVSPEGLEIANAYLQCDGSIKETAKTLCVPEEKVAKALNKREVKAYIDNVYLDLGYRNRFKLGALLDEIIESKLEEARDAEVYTNKDLVDLITLAHKMRQDEIKTQGTAVTNQTNVQINSVESPFGTGNYGALMDKLLNGEKG